MSNLTCKPGGRKQSDNKSHVGSRPRTSVPIDVTVTTPSRKLLTCAVLTVHLFTAGNREKDNHLCAPQLPNEVFTRCSVLPS